MTRPPRFEIEIEKRFPSLPNAPIVERQQSVAPKRGRSKPRDTILTGHDPIEVPRDVRVGVVYAASADNEVMDEALDVFNDAQIHADCVTVEQTPQHAQAAANLVINQPGLDFGT